MKNTPFALEIISVPMSFGGNVGGAELGPDAIKKAGLVSLLKKLGFKVKEDGDIKPKTKKPQKVNPKARHLAEILKVDKKVAESVYNAIKSKMFPLLLGGDHSIAIGSIAGLSKSFDDLVGVIYFDAHGDFNTPETTPSGNVHGMPLALISGQYKAKALPLDMKKPVDPRNIVIIGARDIDPKEKILLKKAGVHVVGMNEIKTNGINKIIAEAIQIAAENGRKVHLSVDIDVLDPKFATGTGTPVPGGLDLSELKVAMSILGSSGCVGSFEMAEVNPLKDEDGTTAPVAVEVINSFFSKFINKI